MKKFVLFFLLLFSIHIQYAQTEALYRDLLPGSVTSKTIRGVLTDYGRDVYAEDHDKIGNLLAELMGERPCSALGFSYLNEEYYISIKDELSNIVSACEWQDSIEIDIDIDIYPFKGKVRYDGTCHPLAVINNIRPISEKDSQRPTKLNNIEPTE